MIVGVHQQLIEVWQVRWAEAASRTIERRSQALIVETFTALVIGDPRSGRLLWHLLLDRSQVQRRERALSLPRRSGGSRI